MLQKVLIIFALGFALAFAQDVKVEGFPPQPISTDPPTSSTQPPTKGTTEPPPAPHTNTTVAPTTPTAPPTSAPTSAPTSTPPSTPAPPAPTTEPPAPSTTPAPPTKGHYVVNAGNKTCLIADLAVQVKFFDGNKTWEVIPSNVSYSNNVSVCSNETQDLPLSWKDMYGGNYSLNFHFVKNETTKKFMVSKIELSVLLPNTTINVTEDKPMFTASVSKSYRCEKEQEIKLEEEGTNTTYAVLKLSHLQLEAFHTGTDNKFSAAEDCAGGSSPDIVPIAVGCALVGLIAIVLIAYLVGRRRSQARGYLSM